MASTIEGASQPDTAGDARAASADASGGRNLLWPMIGAGLAGAACAGLVLAVLWFLLPRRDDATGTLALRLALVDSQLRQLSERPPPATADPKQMAELAARLGVAEQAMRRLDDISARLGAHEQALRRVDDLSTRLAAAEQVPRRLDDHDARLARIETAQAAPRPPVVDPAVAERLAALESATRALTERLAASETAEKSLAARLAASETDDKSVAESLTASETAARSLAEGVAELGRRLDEVSAAGREAVRQAAIASEAAAQSRAEFAADRAARLAIVAAALRAAVARGDPFIVELAAVKPLVADKTELAPLEAFAATGVPSSAVLARELSVLAPAMLTAAAPAPRSGGVLHRLQAGADRLVRIRPINQTPGDDPTAVIARIEVNAAHGDIEAALAEFPKLAQPVRAPAEAWIKKAETRVSAIDITRRLEREAFAALGKVSP